eukprot:556908-Amphidinium_carterae.1
MLKLVRTYKAPRSHTLPDSTVLHLGVTRKRKGRCMAVASYTQRMIPVQIVAIEYILRQLPAEERAAARFSSLTINRSAGCHAHKDMGNKGQSWLQAFGRLQVQNPECVSFPSDFWVATDSTSPGALPCPMKLANDHGDGPRNPTGCQRGYFHCPYDRPVRFAAAELHAVQPSACVTERHSMALYMLDMHTTLTAKDTSFLRTMGYQLIDAVGASHVQTCSHAAAAGVNDASTSPLNNLQLAGRVPVNDVDVLHLLPDATIPITSSTLTTLATAVNQLMETAPVAHSTAQPATRHPRTQASLHKFFSPRPLEVLSTGQTPRPLEVLSTGQTQDMPDAAIVSAAQPQFVQMIANPKMRATAASTSDEFCAYVAH